MIKSLKLRVGAALLALAFQGPPAYAAADAVSVIRFSDATSLSTDATSLSIYVDARPPKEYPHVMYRAPFTFEQAAKAWADSHFSLSGNSVNTLRITLREGDITEKLLPKTGGIKGWFTKDQSAEYEARLAVEVAVVDPNGKVLASADGKASHTRTVPEGSTEEDKRHVWADMIKAAFDGLDAELQPRIRSTMANYVH
ncbi:MAG: hypothetical protein ACYCZX_20110 [Rhodospirillaceae bacterium]